MKRLISTPRRTLRRTGALRYCSVGTRRVSSSDQRLYALGTSLLVGRGLQPPAPRHALLVLIRHLRHPGLHRNTQTVEVHPQQGVVADGQHNLDKLMVRVPAPQASPRSHPSRSGLHAARLRRGAEAASNSLHPSASGPNVTLEMSSSVRPVSLRPCRRGCPTRRRPGTTTPCEGPTALGREPGSPGHSGSGSRTSNFFDTSPRSVGHAVDEAVPRSARRWQDSHLGETRKPLNAVGGRGGVLAALTGGPGNGHQRGEKRQGKENRRHRRSACLHC